MKVMVLNSSPRGKTQSKTTWVLDHLIQGMKAAGATVETFSLSEQNIAPCTGCFACWTQTPGTCIQRDDMSETLMPKWIHSDMVVYATPLYFSTMNAQMKAFIDRSLPVLLPFLKRQNNITFHPPRYEPPKAVWVSVAGFPEPSVFDAFAAYLERLFGDLLLATIFRPASELFVGKLYKARIEDVADALQTAGREIIEKGGVSPPTYERITHPIADPDDIADLGNLYWSAFVEARLSPTQYFEQGLCPKPMSIRHFFLMLKAGFNPEAAGHIRATVQFHFSGKESVVCHFVIDNGSITPAMGPSQTPTLVIESPFDLWMDIMTGREDGLEMFKIGAFRAAGHIDLLLQMQRWFSE